MTVTETETETATPSSCAPESISTSTAPSSTPTCGPSTDCSSLFLNPGFDEFESIGNTLKPWYFDEEQPSKSLVVSVEGLSVFEDTGVLRVDNPRADWRAFTIGQIIRPCPGTRYYLRATVSCGADCPARSHLVAIMYVRRREGGRRSYWYAVAERRVDFEDVRPQTTLALTIGPDAPFSTAEEPREGVEFAAELHVRFVPREAPVPWTLRVDDVEMVAVPET